MIFKIPDVLKALYSSSFYIRECSSSAFVHFYHGAAAVSTVASKQEGCGFDHQACGLSVWSLSLESFFLPVSALVLRQHLKTCTCGGLGL